MSDHMTRILLEASLAQAPKKPMTPKVPQATQFDPEQIKRLAEALRQEILRQETVLDKCAITELYDEAMGMCDHISNLLHFIEKDADDYLGNSPRRNPRFRDPTFRAGGWGEV